MVDQHSVTYRTPKIEPTQTCAHIALQEMNKITAFNPFQRFFFSFFLFRCNVCSCFRFFCFHSPKILIQYSVVIRYGFFFEKRTHIHIQISHVQCQMQTHPSFPYTGIENFLALSSLVAATLTHQTVAFRRKADLIVSAETKSVDEIRRRTLHRHT